MFFNRHRHLTPEQRKSHVANRRVHLANERTFLAWIRTAISVIAFGFIVEKFSLFFRLNFPKKLVSPDGYEKWSDFIGLSIIVLGGFIGFLAMVRYINTEKDIEINRFRPSIIFDLLFTVIFLVLVAFIVLYVFDAQRHF